MTSTATSGRPVTQAPATHEAPSAPRLGFKRHLRVAVARDDQVCLFGERGLTVLAGPTVSAIAPLLDGSRDLAALLADLPVGVSANQVAATLSRLAELGVLTVRPSTSPADDAAMAYWDGADVDATAAVAALATGTVAIIAIGDVDVDLASRTLRNAGLGVIPGSDQPTADLTVVLCDDYLDPRLAGIDAAQRDAGRPWLLARPTGAIVWIGPVFQPESSGCWHCLAEPLSRHRGAEACAREGLDVGLPVAAPACSVPALAGTAMNLIALEATKWLAGQRHPGQRAVWTFDSIDLTGQHHVLRARPQCPVCGDPELIRAHAHQPIILQSRADATGHRGLPVDRMWEQYQHLVSPITGIVKEIRRNEQGPAFFNSFLSGANMATRVRDLTGLRANLRNANGGKGVNALAARVSALCEAVERYSGTFHGDEERIRGSLRMLGERAIHPNACQLFHERQYRTRCAWNAQHSPFQYVDEPFEETTVADWTPVWSMTQQRHRLLPTALLYYGAPDEPGQCHLFADSNGNAAGSTVEDAILHGLLEVVERDAVALWWYNRSRMPGVDLDSLADPWIDDLRSVYAALGREVWVLDITSDLAVPTMVAVSRRTGHSTEDIMFGFGAHLDPRIAVRRALTELNQLMPGVLRDSEKDSATDDASSGDRAGGDPDARRWWRYATVVNQPYVLPDPGQAPLGLLAYDYAPCGDIRVEVESIQHRLEARGMELLVLDQTRPDIKLPVVKVIVPGMRHFWARLAPGRLYDVPVALGRQPTATRFEDLNPYPMFL